MLIAGDIGSKTRLALVSPEAGRRKFVAKEEFHGTDLQGTVANRRDFLGQDRRPPPPVST